MNNCLRDLAIKIHYQSCGIVPRHAKKNIYALFVIVIHKLTKTYRKDLTKECRSIVRDESSVYFNVTAKHV